MSKSITSISILRDPDKMSKTGRRRYEMVMDQYHKGELFRDGKEVTAWDDASKIAQESGEKVSEIMGESLF